MRVNIIGMKFFSYESDHTDVQQAVDNAVGTFLHTYMLEDESGNPINFWDDLDIEIEDQGNENQLRVLH